jgi:hypothetical protein
MASMKEKKRKRNRHWGSSLDGWLKEEGIYNEVLATLELEIVVAQIQQAMRKKRITRRRMAELMKSSPAQVEKMLNPRDGKVTINTLHKAAEVVGKRLEYKLV